MLINDVKRLKWGEEESDSKIFKFYVNIICLHWNLPIFNLNNFFPFQ